MLRSSLLSLLLLLTLSTPAGCATGSVGLDAGQSAVQDADDERFDASEPSDEVAECEGASDGERCGESEVTICIAGECVPSRCGDGFVDVGEECDDGNATLRDGCENDCTTTCRSDADCDDGNICNGIEQCVAVGRGGGKICVGGEAPVCGGDASAAAGSVSLDSNPCVLHYCDPGAPDLESACQVEAFEIFCYPDEDQDGFPALDEARKRPTIGRCECPPKWSRARADRAWDCNDKNPMVRPDLDASLYFTEPYCKDGSIAVRAGSGPCVPEMSGTSCEQYICADKSVPSFDYNCDGEETRRDESTGGRCTFVLLGCTGVRAYEVDSPVPCGGRAKYALCESGRLQLCESETRMQECR